MAWSDATAAANRALIGHFGIPVDYQAGSAIRRIQAAPGDVTEVPRETSRGIEMIQSCQWLIDLADLKDLGDKRRGHIIIMPSAPKVGWIVESGAPDLTGFITLSTVHAILGSIG